MRLVELHRHRRLFFITIVRVEEFGAHEQQDNVGFTKAVVDLVRPLSAWTDTAVMPVIDEALAPQQCEVSCQLFTQPLVLMRVRDKEAISTSGFERQRRRP